jgi:hypothetical protein
VGHRAGMDFMERRKIHVPVYTLGNDCNKNILRQNN